MIWTVVLWLGVQGQTGVALTHDAEACGQGAEVRTLELSKTADNSDHSALYACLAAPAEHVFEIRTKRDLQCGIMGPKCQKTCLRAKNELDTDSAWTEGREDAYTCLKCERDAEIKFDSCPVTRELWLDGKRLGIIKGLE